MLRAAVNHKSSDTQHDAGPGEGPSLGSREGLPGKVAFAPRNVGEDKLLRSAAQGQLNGEPTRHIHHDLFEDTGHRKRAATCVGKMLYLL